MSYYAELGKSGKTIAARKIREHRAGDAKTAEEAPAGGPSKLILFAGLGAAALVGLMLFKKSKKKGTPAPSISLFAAPKVP